MYCSIDIAFNCYFIIKHANINMCRIESMYYRDGISMVIINDGVKYNNSDEKMLELDSK